MAFEMKFLPSSTHNPAKKKSFKAVKGKRGHLINEVAFTENCHMIEKYF